MRRLIVIGGASLLLCGSCSTSAQHISEREALAELRQLDACSEPGAIDRVLIAPNSPGVFVCESNPGHTVGVLYVFRNADDVSHEMSLMKQTLLKHSLKRANIVFTTDDHAVAMEMRTKLDLVVFDP